MRRDSITSHLDMAGLQPYYFAYGHQSFTRLEKMLKCILKSGSEM
jgi:hypothetical protein